MASEIRVNQIQNRSGLGTVTFSDSGVVISGITTISDLRTTGGALTVGTGASISSPATNVLALGTNNSEALRIDNSGRLGIGTTNPQVRFQVNGSSAKTSSDSPVTFSSNDASNAFQLVFQRSASTDSVPVWSIQSVEQSVGYRSLSLQPNGGNILMPSQPSGAWALTVNGSGVRSVSIKKNTGNHVSSVPGGNGSTHGSVGRFTAPVNGAYLISLFSTAVGPSSQCLMSVYGSWTSATNNVAAGAEVFDCRATRPPEDGGGWSQVFYFNATDYWEIDWYRPSATAYIDSTMTMNVTVHLLG